MIITGSGAVEADHYFSENDELIERSFFANLKDIQTIKIYDDIRSLEEFSFVNLKTVKELYLPSSLRRIGYHCFSGCILLEAIHRADPNSIKNIGIGAFANTKIQTSDLLSKYVSLFDAKLSFYYLDEPGVYPFN